MGPLLLWVCKTVFFVFFSPLLVVSWFTLGCLICIPTLGLAGNVWRNLDSIKTWVRSNIHVKLDIKISMNSTGFKMVWETCQALFSLNKLRRTTLCYHGFHSCLQSCKFIVGYRWLSDETLYVCCLFFLDTESVVLSKLSTVWMESQALFYRVENMFLQYLLVSNFFFFSSKQYFFFCLL